MANLHSDFVNTYRPTDRSEINNDIPVGALLVIPNLQIINKFKEPIFKSILRFEVICSDSKASIDAISNVNRNRMSIMEAIAHYSMFTSLCKKHKVILQWAPAHVGIDGNERAYWAAKQATKMTSSFTEFDSPMEDKMIDKVIKNLDKFSFEENWNFSGSYFVTCKTTRSHGLKIYDKLTRKEGFIMFYLRSQHAGVQSYCARFFGEEEYCNNEETIAHVLLDCDNYQHQRQSLGKFLTQNSMKCNINLLLGGVADEKLSIQIFWPVIQFLQKIRADKKI